MIENVSGDPLISHGRGTPPMSCAIHQRKDLALPYLESSNNNRQFGI